jgi:hypothetical protein
MTIYLPYPHLHLCFSNDMDYRAESAQVVKISLSSNCVFVFSSLLCAGGSKNYEMRIIDFKVLTYFTFQL